MTLMEYRIISIGALDAHPLRGERTAVRTGHATTTLIRSGQTAIIVDPGLPAAPLAARLEERAGLKPSAITHVFLTSFRPDLRRGIELFDNASWLIAERERESVGVAMISEYKRAAETGEQDLAAALEKDIALLRRCEPAPDRLAPRVDLFPLPGVTPGLTGLVLAGPRHTTVLAGDAVPTEEHLTQGKVVPWAPDVTQARESFAEVVEIADLIILGRDNIVVNPTKRPF